MPVSLRCLRPISLTSNHPNPQRQSRGRSSAPRSAPKAAPAQSRGAHTAAAPSGYAPAHAPAPSPPVTATAQPKQPGMMAQMAATAGSVAVGSTIGHGISNMLFGGGGNAAAPEQAPPVQQQQQQSMGHCEIQAKGAFLRFTCFWGDLAT